MSDDLNEISVKEIDNKFSFTFPNNPFIRVYDDVLDENTCKKIIDQFLKSSEVMPGKTASGFTEKKKNTELYIDPESADWASIDYDLFSAYSKWVKHYFSMFDWLHFPFRDVGYFIRRYEKNLGYYDTHVDVSVEKNSRRILAGIFYLNTVVQGGETQFTELDIGIQPVCGRLLLFPPMWMYPHKAMMPVSNDKFTINTFFELVK